jgi:hypothetical protein
MVGSDSGEIADEAVLKAIVLTPLKRRVKKKLPKEDSLEHPVYAKGMLNGPI